MWGEPALGPLLKWAFSGSSKHLLLPASFCSVHILGCCPSQWAHGRITCASLTDKACVTLSKWTLRAHQSGFLLFLEHRGICFSASLRQAEVSACVWFCLQCYGLYNVTSEPKHRAQRLRIPTCFNFVLRSQSLNVSIISVTETHESQPWRAALTNSGLFKYDKQTQMELRDWNLRTIVAAF